MHTKEKKEPSFLNRLFTAVSVVYLLLGVLLIVIPDLQMRYVCYGISIILVVLGIIFIVKYFLTESYRNLNQYGFSIGVFLVIIGICTLIKNEQMAKEFQMYIGVCILLTAIVKLQNSMDLKALKDRTWAVICGVSLLIMACAVLIILNPFTNQTYEVALTYFSLLFDGVISLFSYYYLAFRLKRSERKSERKINRASVLQETEPQKTGSKEETEPQEAESEEDRQEAEDAVQEFQLETEKAEPGEE